MTCFSEGISKVKTPAVKAFKATYQGRYTLRDCESDALSMSAMETVHRPTARDNGGRSTSYSEQRPPTMPRRIRGFCVTSARKFKLNNDPSLSDNQKNG